MENYQEYQAKQRIEEARHDESQRLRAVCQKAAIAVERAEKHLEKKRKEYAAARQLWERQA